MLLPHATWRASEGHFVRALQACVHYFSAYPRMNFRIRSPSKGELDLYVLPGTPFSYYILHNLRETLDFMKILHRQVFRKSESHLVNRTFKMVGILLLKISIEP
jgi:hypothetical protein